MTVDLSTLDDWQLRDVESLADLHAGRDPRGLAQMIADDPYSVFVVQEVEPRKDGEHQGIRLDEHMWTSVTGPEVKVGDTVWLYDGGRGGFGSMRHGWALNGEVIEWKTEWERYADRIAMLAQHDRGRREHYDQAKAKLDAWYEQLDGPYRERIDRFRAERPDFDVESGTYEVYPVLMAQRIEAWVRENDATVESFRDLPHDEQAAVIHAGEPDEDGISGHQFDSACGLARAVMEGVAV